MALNPLATATEDEDPSTMIANAVGGVWGITESIAPAVVFITMFSVLGQSAGTAGIVAGVIGGAAAALRLIRGQTVQFAAVGLVGLGISVLTVRLTGRAEDFFLPGILLNGAYTAAYVVSIAIGWPVIGIVLETAMGKGTDWRQDQHRRRVYRQITWVWAGLFFARLTVQLPLYLAGAVGALGVARIAMGIPGFAITVWVSYRMLVAGGLMGQTPASEAPGDSHREHADRELDATSPGQAGA